MSLPTLCPASNAHKISSQLMISTLEKLRLRWTENLPSSLVSLAGDLSSPYSIGNQMKGEISLRSSKDQGGRWDYCHQSWKLCSGTQPKETPNGCGCPAASCCRGFMPQGPCAGIPSQPSHTTKIPHLQQSSLGKSNALIVYRAIINPGLR